MFCQPDTRCFEIQKNECLSVFLLTCIKKSMAKYERKDTFYKKAKREGFVSRASYKIEEIDKKFNLIRINDTVIDLGAAPGGWSQVISKKISKKGKLIGIDLLPLKINPPDNMDYLQADILEEESLIWLKEKASQADVIVSDMAPNMTGIKFRDSAISYELADM